MTTIQPAISAPRPIDPDRCIRAESLVKEFHTEVGTRRVLDGISFSVGPGERMGVLGRNGAGKSTLIQLLSGIQRPTRGRVHRGLRMSWPLALGGGFEGELTGYDNIRFISKLYGVPLDEIFDFIADFSELGKQLYVPMRFYSSGMRMRVAFAMSIAINFECFLIDEALLVGDMRFQEKCKRALFEDRKDRAMIMAVHGDSIVEEYCNKVLVMKAGRGRVFEDIKLACSIYHTL